MKRWAQESKIIANDNKNSKCHFANSKMPYLYLILNLIL